MRATPDNAGAKIRARKALELRAEGKSYQEIADLLGYSNRGTAYRTIHRALAHEVTAPARELINLELQRLDAIQEAHWAIATTPGRGKDGIMSQTRAATVVLRVQQRRAKLLGLDDWERRLVDLAERRQKLDERDSRLAVEFFTRVMNRIGLTPEQRALLADIMPAELEAITARVDVSDDGDDEVLEEADDE